MARLANGEWLMQQIGGQVILFRDHTEEEVIRFDPSNVNAVAQAQFTISQDARLSPEEKCFAHFWSGYFYAHATGI